MVIYVEFTTKSKARQVASIEEAKRIVLRKFPGAHFGRWIGTKQKRKITVWPSSVAEEEYQRGDKSPRYKPRAFIVVQQDPAKSD